MKHLSIIVIFSYIWLAFWWFFSQAELYSSSLGIAFLTAFISISFLIQALFISYYLIKLLNNTIICNLYSYVVVPIFFIFFQNIILMKMDITNAYKDLVVWGGELLLLVVIMRLLIKYMGETLLPLANPDAQLAWTKRFPPREVKDMYRGFCLLIFFLAIPFILYLLY